MNIINQRDTLIETINALKQKGFTEDFKSGKEYIKALKSDKEYDPGELKIAQFFRFEAMTNPADAVELYALKANDDTKGTLVMVHGAKHSQNTALIKQLEEL